MHYAECSSHDEDFLERRTATTWPFLQLIDQQLLGNGKNGENKDKDCSNSSGRYFIELWWWQQLSSSLLTLQITSSSRWLPVLPHRSWVMTVTDTAPTILLTKIKTARNAEHFSASGYLLQPHRANWTNCTKSALCGAVKRSIGFTTGFHNHREVGAFSVIVQLCRLIVCSTSTAASCGAGSGNVNFSPSDLSRRGPPHTILHRGQVRKKWKTRAGCPELPITVTQGDHWTSKWSQQNITKC